MKTKQTEVHSGNFKLVNGIKASVNLSICYEIEDDNFIKIETVNPSAGNYIEISMFNVQNNNNNNGEHSVGLMYKESIDNIQYCINHFMHTYNLICNNNFKPKQR